MGDMNQNGKTYDKVFTLIGKVSADNAKQTIEKLVRLGKPAVPALICILIDNRHTDRIRLLAATALGKIGDVSAVPHLLSYCKSQLDFKALKNEALEKVIFEMGEPSIPALLEDLRNPDNCLVSTKLLVQLNAGAAAINALRQFMMKEPAMRYRYSRRIDLVVWEMRKLGKWQGSSQPGIKFDSLNLNRFPTANPRQLARQGAMPLKKQLVLQ